MNEIVHLRVCSEYSLLYSAARLADVAALAVEEGMWALGVADRNGMYGGLANWRVLQATGLQPLLGSVLRVVRRRTRGGSSEWAEVTVYAASAVGYSSLTTLATQAGMALEGGGQENVWEEVSAQTNGLICLAGDRAGPLADARIAGDARAAVRYLERLREWFGRDSVYVELCVQGEKTDAARLAWLAMIADKLDLPTVATTEIRHLKERDLRNVDVLAAIDRGVTIDVTAALRSVGASYHFRGVEEMRRLFRDYPAALAATQEIAARCVFELPFGDRRMPVFSLQKGQTEAAELRRLAEAGLRERKPQPTADYAARLAHELRVIEELGFSGYFLIVWDFMNFAHHRGISTGPGRGSAAGSLVAYALRITDVDPIAYHLLFERFLNPERVTWPDIDIDFEAERRYEVIEYVAQKYGHDCVAQIGTLGTLAARAAVRDAGRALGATSALIDKAARQIPTGHGVTLAKSLQENDELRKMVAASPVLVRVFEVAEGIEGLPRHASVHAAGVVISQDPIARTVPLMRGQESVPVTQYSMAEVEAAGLLKMDFLGLRTLTICDRALRYIGRARGGAPQLDEVPFDAATEELLGRGDTDGCFQLESTGVKQVLREMRPRALEDLIAVVSLYRPGPMEQIPGFLKARRGETPIRYEAPELAPILAPTYGILVYQEQIMQIASTLAGFSLGEADVLRRAISKKKKNMIDEAKSRFVEGCLRNGHAKDTAERVYALIERFADYGFNRSHAAAYAMLAQKTAHLKANYRPEFMAALMTESVSRPDKLAQYAEDCRRRRIPVLPPDLRFSEAECVPESTGGKLGVRLGLYAVKNVGVMAVEEILAERRENGMYQGVEATLARLEGRAVNKRVVESLIMAGAFDFLGVSRTSLLVRLSVQRGGRKTSDGQLAFPQLITAQEEAVTPVTEPADAPGQADEWERDLIGFIVSRDPFADVAQMQAQFGLATIAETMEQVVDVGAMVRLLGRVSDFRQVQTRRGEAMAFLTVEDGTSHLELIVFPNVYRALVELPTVGQIVHIETRRESGRGERFVVVALHGIEGVQQEGAEGRSDKPLRLFIRVTHAMSGNSVRMQTLRRELLRYPGAMEVVLVYEGGQKRLLNKVRVRLDENLIHALETMVGKENVKID